MERILVIDDNQVNREYLVTLLYYKGYDVVEAADGREGLLLVQDKKPDLVICDVLMPVLDGYGFVHGLRRNPDLATIPIIFYTAHYLEQEARDLAAMGGVSHVLEKPCEPEKILNTIREALDTPLKATSGYADDSFKEKHLRLLTRKLYSKTGEVYQANQRLAALIELNLQLASEKNPHQLLNHMCHGARELLGARYAALAIGDGINGRPHYFATSGIATGQSEVLRPESVNKGLLGEVVRTNQIKHHDARDNIDSGLPAGFPEYDHLIAVPISSLTHTYGWLCLTDMSGSGKFSDEDEQLVHILASQTGRIYENGSLYDKVRFHSSQLEQEIARRNQTQIRLETQYNIARILSEDLPFEETIPQLLEEIATNINFDVAFMWEVDDSLDELFCVESWHSEHAPELAEFVEKTRKYTINRGHGLSAEVWSETAPKWVPDMLTEIDRYRTPPELVANYQAAALHAAAAFPVVLRGKVWGVLTFYSREILIQDQDLMEMFNALSSQIGQFMERRLQRENINRLNRLYSVLSNINTTIVHVRDRKELFRKACDILVKQGQLAMAWVGFFNKRTGEVASLTARSNRGISGTTTLKKKLRRKKDRAIIREYLVRSAPIVANQLRPDQTLGFPLADEIIPHGARSAAAFPLEGGDDSHGLLAMYSTEPGFFDEQELMLLKELAEDLSFAMQFIRNEERLNYLAYHEPITGLNNRVAMYIELADTTKKANRENTPFAVLLINIIGFRDINDALGHKNGDELLRLVAKRLKESVFKSDTVACLGGDNFAILLPHLADKDHITTVVEKVIDSLRPPFSISTLPVNVEVSIGVALFPDHGTSADILWQRADVALRHARETHQQTVFYNVEIDDYDPHRLSLIGELRRAIENNELVLHYQPLVSLKSGKTIGVEALVRWQHPQHGIIYPDTFIPYSEHTGLIHLLTSWVLQAALGQVRAWKDAGLELELAVNLSAYSLHNPDLVNQIRTLTSDFQYPIHKLTLEITETAIMVDPNLARQVLTDLCTAGAHLCIDDFGTGQSSLAYVKDLPVNRMKIDKSFVIGIREPRNAGIVRSAIDLGHNLDLFVTAEGIEDKESLQKLHDYGCDHAQGYYLCRPQTASNLVTWLRNSRWPASAVQEN